MATPFPHPAPLVLLLVDDSEADVILTWEALREARAYCQLHVVNDGLQALEFLHQENGYADVPRPHALLLDVHLPRKDGLEVLQDIKADPDLKDLHVFLLLGSAWEEEHLRARRAEASGYLVKPLGVRALDAALQRAGGLKLHHSLTPVEYHR